MVKTKWNYEKKKQIDNIVLIFKDDMLSADFLRSSYIISASYSDL